MRHLMILAGQSVYQAPLQYHDTHLLSGIHDKAYKQRRMAPHMNALPRPVSWYLHTREVIAYHLNLHNPRQRQPSATRAR